MELIVFLFGSLILLFLSCPWLTHPLSHGFPRFFAFEAILGLAALDAGRHAGWALADNPG